MKYLKSVCCAGLAFALAVGTTVSMAAGTNYVALGGQDSNGGSSWADAWASISNAVRKTPAGYVVFVSNGLYETTAEILVTNAITILGFSGDPTDTTIKRKAVGTANPRHRIFQLTDAGAVLDSMTITNGNTTGDAGGVYMMAGATVRNCIVANNVGSQAGGVRFQAGSGGLVENCIIRGNVCTYTGGGVNMAVGGTLRNCLIVNNKAATQWSGGVNIGHTAARVENCTITGNSSAYSGGGIRFGAAGVVSNTICYFNYSNDFEDANHSGSGNFRNSCTTPLPAGAGNTTANPLFVNANAGDFRLLPESPCSETGGYADWMAGALDLDGRTRVNGVVDRGCYELVATDLVCGFSANAEQGFMSTSIVFTAGVDGTNLTSVHYYWDFNGDGNSDTDGTGKKVVTNQYTSAGLYTVSLTVSNAVNEGAVYSRTNYIKIGPPIVYAAKDGSNTNTFPYDEWGTAASNIAHAVDAAVHGSLVLVKKGNYVLTRTIAVTNALTLRSVSGAGQTVMDGNLAVPCVYVRHADAVVDGFTLTRGSANRGSAGHLNGMGTIQNCLIVNNTGSGVNATGGLLMRGGYLLNCAIMKNASGNHSGGGIDYLTTSKYSGFIRNCLIAGNEVGNTYTGGGIRGSAVIVENCTIVRNRSSATTAANVSGGVFLTSSTVRNSIIYDNIGGATNWVGSLTCSYNCTTPPIGTPIITNDPAFVRSGEGYGLSLSNYNFRLQETSLCKDVGTSLTWHNGATDLDRNARVVNETVDLGCYEWWPPAGTVIQIK